MFVHVSSPSTLFALVWFLAWCLFVPSGLWWLVLAISVCGVVFVSSRPVLDGLMYGGGVSVVMLETRKNVVCVTSTVMPCVASFLLYFRCAALDY